jgi:hypothetical protein
MDRIHRTAILALSLGLPFAETTSHAAVVYSDASFAAGDILDTVDAFRADLGALNLPGSGSVGSGRREINWDGVPDGFAAPNLLPPNFFNANSPRGVELSTPGTGFAVSADSANPTSTPTQFADINAAFPGIFEPFSAQRLFTALGSNVTDVHFFISGSSTPAVTRGFGVVFSDVDVDGGTSLSFYDTAGALLGTWAAPALLGDESFSFLGVTFTDPVIARVRIVSGSAPLDTALTEGVDVVTMDDFIYGEPVPEPATWASMIVGMLALAALRLRRLRL